VRFVDVYEPLKKLVFALRGLGAPALRRHLPVKVERKVEDLIADLLGQEDRCDDLFDNLYYFDNDYPYGRYQRDRDLALYCASLVRRVMKTLGAIRNALDSVLDD